MKKYKKSDYLYTALFCEENIWHLIQTLINEGVKDKDMKVLFITNNNKQIAIFNQLSAENEHAVIWDYHVLLMVNIEQSFYIFDFDTRLSFATDYENYLKKSFPSNINPQYSGQFRIIPAESYLKCFYSDRSHMKNIIPEDDFPEYPAILSNSTNKIDLKRLFHIENKIEHTFIIHNTKKLKDWIEKII